MRYRLRIRKPARKYLNKNPSPKTRVKAWLEIALVLHTITTMVN